MHLVLGSSSSARVRLLEQLGIEFTIRTPNFNERSYPFDGDPIAYTQTLALKKNESIPKINLHELIVSFDTIVWSNGELFNKPQDYHEAFSMLESLSGSKHQVITAVCLSKNEHYLVDYASTWVEFNILDKSKIEKFLEDPQYLNRSGAYTISGFGGLLVKSIQGTYDNIIGLPINTLETLLNQMDESLWS